jgi:hypothetical protein
MVEKSGTIRVMLHIIIVMLKLKRKKFKDIPINIQGIIRELRHKQRRYVMSNEKDFDFSLIVNDCESSDGQKRHQYFTAEENESKAKPETIQK